MSLIASKPGIKVVRLVLKICIIMEYSLLFIDSLTMLKIITMKLTNIVCFIWMQQKELHLQEKNFAVCIFAVEIFYESLI